MKFQHAPELTLICALGTVLLGSCSRGGDSVDDSLSDASVSGEATAQSFLPEAAMALVDSANALVRLGLHSEALDLYRQAAVEAPGEPVPWFGIAMVARQLGDSALADSAQAVLDAAGAPVGGSPHGSPLPQGHPPARPPGS